ncbi:hypothetical protein GCM10010149_50130 [Nonomuraea roseoviolacea subsp. roseoviolacea]
MPRAPNATERPRQSRRTLRNALAKSPAGARSYDRRACLLPATFRNTGQEAGGFQGEVLVRNTGTAAATGFLASWDGVSTAPSPACASEWHPGARPGPCHIRLPSRVEQAET